MDNNNQTPTPVVTTPNPTVPTPEGGGKKIILMLVIGVVIVLAVVGAIYYFLSNQQVSTQSQTITTAPAQPSVAQTKDALDQELDSINVSSQDNDFNALDSDLKKL